jgi:hypothetical protein
MHIISRRHGENIARKEDQFIGAVVLVQGCGEAGGSAGDAPFVGVGEG